MKVRATVSDSASGVWFASVQEFDGAWATGATPDDALINLRLAIWDWFAARTRTLRVPAVG